MRGHHLSPFIFAKNLNMKKINIIIIRYSLFIIHYSLLISCSQQIPPTGGKRDVITPKLLSSIPINKQTNYKGKSVELFFDEYIVAENLQQKLIVTPDMGEYDVKSLSKGIKLTFKKQPPKDRTYSLSFGDAIKDFSEKNPAKNLRLVFSSGPVIDSAFVSGKITDIQTNKPLLDILVGLYKHSDTLNPEKIKPTYFTRTDSAGNFSIENIQPDTTYKIIAIDDKNRSMTFNAKVEKIGYLSDSIVIKPSTQMSGVRIPLYYVNYLPIKYKTGASKKPNIYEISYDRGILKTDVSFQNKADSIPYFQPTTNELRFYNTKNHKDSIAVKISVSDSLGNKVERIQKIKFREGKVLAKEKEVLTVAKNLTAPLIEPNNIVYTLSFNKPLSVLKTENIKMYSDSLKEEKLIPTDLIWENQNTILTITKKFSAKKELKINIPKGTFISVEGDTLAAITDKLGIMEAENYGLLNGEVIKPPTSFFVELLDENFKVIKTLYNQKSFRFEYIKPASYHLRVIIDSNENKKWDGGNYKTKLQPEAIYFYPVLIKVRKNFEIEGINIELSTK